MSGWRLLINSLISIRYQDTTKCLDVTLSRDVLVTTGHLLLVNCLLSLLSMVDENIMFLSIRQQDINMTWHWSACLVVDWFSVWVPYHHDYVPQLNVLRFSSNRLVVNMLLFHFLLDCMVELDNVNSEVKRISCITYSIKERKYCTITQYSWTRNWAPVD